MPCCILRLQVHFTAVPGLSFAYCLALVPPGHFVSRIGRIRGKSFAEFLLRWLNCAGRPERSWTCRCTLGTPAAAQCCTAWERTTQHAQSSHSTHQASRGKSPAYTVYCHNGICSHAFAFGSRQPREMRLYRSAAMIISNRMCWCACAFCNRRALSFLMCGTQLPWTVRIQHVDFVCRCQLPQRVGAAQALPQREDLRARA